MVVSNPSWFFPSQMSSIKNFPGQKLNRAGFTYWKQSIQCFPSSMSNWPSWIHRPSRSCEGIQRSFQPCTCSCPQLHTFIIMTKFSISWKITLTWNMIPTLRFVHTCKRTKQTATKILPPSWNDCPQFGWYFFELISFIMLRETTLRKVPNFVSLESMKNIACVHCNLNKIRHKEIFFWPTQNNHKKAWHSKCTIISGRRDYLSKPSCSWDNEAKQALPSPFVAASYLKTDTSSKYQNIVLA